MTTNELKNINELNANPDEQTVAPIAQHGVDPVVGLCENERKARDAFETSDEIKDKECYDRAERLFLESAEVFLTTPAASLEGLLLQAKYLRENNELDEVDVLIAGIENLINDGCKLQPYPSMASDPVIVHGFELAKLRAEELAIDEKRHEDYKDAEYAAQSQHLYDKATALEDLIATMKATSFEGSLLQVALVFNQLNNLDTFEYDEADIRKVFRTCCRLLYSVRDVLQNASALKPEEISIDFYMGDIQNPWLAVEERIEMAQVMQQPKAA
jgi:hypothetical protein